MLGGLDCDWSGNPGDPATSEELCDAHFGRIIQVRMRLYQKIMDSKLLNEVVQQKHCCHL